MAVRGSIRLFDFVSRNQAMTPFLAVFSSFGHVAGQLLNFLSMTAKAFGWLRSGYHKAASDGGLLLMGQFTCSKPIRHRYCVQPATQQCREHQCGNRFEQGRCRSLAKIFGKYDL